MAGGDKSKRNSHILYLLGDKNDSGSVEDGEGAQVLPINWVLSGIGKQLAVFGSVGEKFKEGG